MIATRIFGLSLALLASSALLMNHRAAGAIIESEPNNTLATADVINRNLPTFADAGAVSLASGGGDVDVFSINLLAGDFLLANTTGIAGLPLGSSPDTVLGLFDSAGALLIVDDDGGPELGSNFTYSIASDGNYYIAVTGFPDGVNGSPGDSFGATGVFDGTNPDDGTLHSEVGPYLLTVSVVPAQIPEPSSCLLAAVGALLACGGRRRG